MSDSQFENTNESMSTNPVEVDFQAHFTGPSMCPDHPRWHEFIDRLGGQEGCNFRQAVPDDEESITWTCDSSGACPLATRILIKMGLTTDEIANSLFYFHQEGGCCDCEILFNVRG